MAGGGQVYVRSEHLVRLRRRLGAPLILPRGPVRQLGRQVPYVAHLSGPNVFFFFLSFVRYVYHEAASSRGESDLRHTTRESLHFFTKAWVPQLA
jgi:hypothetical protein